MSTFVSVGNAHQSFSRLLNEVCRIAELLPQPVFVQRGHTGFACASCEGAAFVGMEVFARRVREADLLILHAGAGSVIHAIQAGKIPVVVPRRLQFEEHVNDHQVELAGALESAGKVVMVIDVNDLLKATGEALRRQAAQQENAQTPSEPEMVAKVRSTLEGYAESLKNVL